MTKPSGSTPNLLTKKILKQITAQFNSPVEWALQESTVPIYCLQIVRSVPNKRIVFFGTWGGANVVIKIFHANNGAKLDFEQDVAGVNILLENNVPTPKILYTGSQDRKRLHIVIYERIMDADSLETLWQQKSNVESIFPLLKKMTIEIATQHVLGILQKDLHLKNFLITKKQIFTLDGGQIKYFDSPLSKNLSIEYLCLFLAQLGAGVQTIQQQLFDIYTRLRGWIVKPRDRRHYKKLLASKNEKRWQHYKRKLFRTTSAFKHRSSFYQTIMYDYNYATPAFLSFLENPEATFSNPSTEILKNGRSSTVVKVSIDGRWLVIKRYNIKNFFHALRRAFRPTRAAHSWEISQCLYAFGITTAKPIAFRENHFLSFRGRSYFAMEYIPGKNLGEYFALTHSKTHENIARQVLQLLKNLAELHLTHGDLKNTNILIHNETPYLIDFDGVQEHKTNRSLHLGFRKDMKRFMQNWEANPLILSLFKKLLFT